MVYQPSGASQSQKSAAEQNKSILIAIKAKASGIVWMRLEAARRGA